MSKLYTGKGDDGTTGLFYGGRVPKHDARPEAYGTVDEAQAAIGLARAGLLTEGAAGQPFAADLGEILVDVERGLYVLMAELATAPENQHKLDDATTRVTTGMVEELSATTDSIGERFEFPTEFVIPGQSEVAARLDVARTIVRRAERRAVVVDVRERVEGSQVVPYLNRLSSLLWTAARWVESVESESLASREDR